MSFIFPFDFPDFKLQSLQNLSHLWILKHCHLKTLAIKAQRPGLRTTWNPHPSWFTPLPIFFPSSFNRKQMPLHWVVLVWFWLKNAKNNTDQLGGLQWVWEMIHMKRGERKSDPGLSTEMGGRTEGGAGAVPSIPAIRRCVCAVVLHESYPTSCRE